MSWRCLVLFGLIVVASLASGAGPGAAEAARVDASLVAETSAVPARGIIWVGLRQKIAKGWHTYWRYPGDSGLPIQIEWKLPAGVTAGPLHWPRPEAYPVGPLVNFGYADEVLLMAPIEITEAARLDGGLPITAEADWLVCREICIPERKTLALTLGVAATPRPDPESAALFARYRALLPEASPWKATASRTGSRLELRLALPRNELDTVSTARFFPGNEGLIDNPAPQSVSIGPDGLTLAMTVGARVGHGLDELEGLLVIESRRDGQRQTRDVLVGPVPIVSTAGRR